MVLSDIDPDKSGVASGANSTVRQVGGALGVAVIGSLFASLTISKTVAAVRATSIPGALKANAVAGIHAQGAAISPPRGVAADVAATLSRALATGLTEATRPALLAAAAFVLFGAFLSLLIPRTPPVRAPVTTPMVEAFDALEPIEPDHELLDGRGLGERKLGSLPPVSP